MGAVLFKLADGQTMGHNMVEHFRQAARLFRDWDGQFGSEVAVNEAKPQVEVAQFKSIPDASTRFARLWDGYIMIQVQMSGAWDKSGVASAWQAGWPKTHPITFSQLAPSTAS